MRFIVSGLGVEVVFCGAGVLRVHRVHASAVGFVACGPGGGVVIGKVMEPVVDPLAVLDHGGGPLCVARAGVAVWDIVRRLEEEG